ncbi:MULTISPECIES: acyl-CoA dehydrogenase [unclassified Arthrobacter]|uniref:acyl-CoA dehydrogenase n=1 Tax=unclassified Arthrobacter TaxID=235627 RepID=UPI0014928DEF|nr:MULTISPECIES: acyl-CoA dehydrogenase [unclassified Arthrobacter]MBE0008447.1 acyl-CoA dehydrogenase [Arthrobacter sp. AET 35A]NOJ62187.1 acyl-CoA dehydrogenase [Arthrobacter sp. 147(2020)]
MLIIVPPTEEDDVTEPKRSVLLDAGSKTQDALYDQGTAAAGSVAGALALAAELGRSAPLPGTGSTLQLWETLATLAAADLTVARTVEPHLDALAILAQAGQPATEGTWGVFAAEGPGTRLEAHPHDHQGWLLTGRKPWCSLAGRLDHAVVTAHLSGGGRRAFAVALGQPGVTPVTGTWVSRGLSAVDSGPIDFDQAVATPVGDDSWYLVRDGFAWGGLGVAACWYGGAVGVARRLLRSISDRAPDQLALMHLGEVDRRLHAARVSLATAASDIDAGRASGDAGALLAARVRSIVAEAAEAILTTVGHALGPAPLVLEEEHARRVADLQVYLRQHHAERDAVSLGHRLMETGEGQW